MTDNKNTELHTTPEGVQFHQERKEMQRHQQKRRETRDGPATLTRRSSLRS